MNPMALERQLPMLPDQAIMRMLQTTQQDATVWPLVATEMRRRQDLRSRAQNQQARVEQQQGQQPTVREMTEQQIASSGLAQLAPPDVATMAGGGLASLMEDYDEAPRYNGSQEQLVQEWKTLPPVRRDAASSFGELLGNVFSRNDKRVDPETGEPISFAQFLQRREQRAMQAAAAAPQPAAPAPAAYPDETAKGMRTRPVAPVARPRVITPAAQAAAPAAAAAPAYAAPSVDELSKRIETVQAGRGTPFDEEYRGLLRQQSGSAAQALLEAQGLGRLRDELISRREQRIGKEEAGLSKERDRELGLALLQAGGTLAQTPGAFGAGAGRALKEFGTVYGAGLEKLKKAQDRINDARDRLDEARLGGAEVQAKARDDYNKAITAAQSMRLNALREDFNIGRKAATEIVTTQAKLDQGGAEMASRERMNQADIASRERIARIQAAATRDAIEGRTNTAATNALLNEFKTLEKHWADNQHTIRRELKNVKTFEDFLRYKGFDTSKLPSGQFAGAGGSSGLRLAGVEPAPKP